MQNKDNNVLSRRSIMIGASAGVAAVATSSIAAAAQENRVASQAADGVRTTGLTGKRVLVTGASRGIGAGIALAFADQGADVAITYLRSTEKAATVTRTIERSSPSREVLPVSSALGTSP